MVSFTGCIIDCLWVFDERSDNVMSILCEIGSSEI